MKQIAPLLLLAGLLALAGCNTVKGVGQDVQKAGSAIENAAKK
jgi:predicted small secreted protein